MADVSSATKFFPTAKEGFTTTTSGSVSPGASSVGLASVSGLTNGDVMVFVIDPTDATKKQVFTGTIDTSGSQVTNVVWAEGTNVAHSSGATVVDYETATHWALYSKGMLVQHNQTGTHKNITNTGGMTNSGGLTTDTLTVSSGTTLPAGDIASADIAASAITPEKLLTGTGTSWAWQSYTPTWTSDGSAPSIGNGTLTGRYIQIGKTVHFRISFIGGSSTTWGSGTYFVSIPVAAHADYTSNSGISLGGYGEDNGVLGISIVGTRMHSTLNKVYVMMMINGTTPYQFWGRTAPMTWDTNDFWFANGTYEAA